MECLHGIRFITINWVVLGHSYLTASYMPLVNTIGFARQVSNASLIIILHNKNEDKHKGPTNLLVNVVLLVPIQYTYLFQLYLLLLFCTNSGTFEE
jgi:hypothetical protein